MSGEINLDWSTGNNAKLRAVTDNTGRRITLGQSNGSLQIVDTATGGKWHYEYALGRLTNVTDPASRVTLRAKYDATGRAVEVGDAVGLNRLGYGTNANNISMRTAFTDSLNYTRVFQHNERGILTNVTDAAGTLLNMQYNENSQPVQITDANGAAATFEYDSQKRLTRQVAADGGEKVFEYAADGKLQAMTVNGERTEIVRDQTNLTENRIRKNGKSVKSTYNSRGQEIHLQVENGLRLDFEYDEKGRKTADVHSDIGRFEKTFDAAGRKISEKSPSGLIQGYEYNADNRLLRQSNNRGLSARGERDASGNLTKIVNSDTDWVQISRDEAGRIVQLTNANGQSRRYAYNSRGSLTRFIGSDGRDLQFQYNERGEMQSAVNAQNARLIYKRNQRDNFAKIQLITSQKNFWQIQTLSYGGAFTKSKMSDCGFFDDGFGFGEWGFDDFWDENFGIDTGFG